MREAIYLSAKMNNNAVSGSLRIVGYVVIAAMAVALGYAAFIALANFSGIAV